MSRQVLLLGASVRALAEGVIRAGLEPIALDLFADADLQAICKTHRVPLQDYPRGFLSLAAIYPGLPILYAGGMENHPKLLEQLALQHPIWGHSASTVRGIRNPLQLQAVLRENGFCMPELIASLKREEHPSPSVPLPQGEREENMRSPLRCGEGPGVRSEESLPSPLAGEGLGVRGNSSSSDSSWWVPKTPPTLQSRDNVASPQQYLLKPLRSGAGQGIRFANPSEPIPSGMILQEFIPGRACSSLFIASDNQARLLGSCEQLIGTPELGAEGFQYAGNIGPIELSESLNEELQAIGQLLAQQFQLQGIFGIDWIESKGRPFIIEVNPRYTASVEVLERATGRCFVSEHLSVFDSSISHSLQQEPLGLCVKGILYATAPTLITPAFATWVQQHQNQVADLPHEGDRIEKGWPICTLFARGSTESLFELAEDLRSCLKPIE
jgi:predicted ATP-grasp superfamily ATP-dependent carboligase